jgi:hypothetical protein
MTRASILRLLSGFLRVGNADSDKNVWLDEKKAEQFLEKLQRDEMDLASLAPEEMKMFLEFLQTEANTCLRECQPLWEIENGAYDLRVEEISQIVEDLSKVDDKKDRLIDLDDLFEKENYDIDEEIDISELKKSRNRLRRRIKELPDLSMLKKMNEELFISMFYNISNAVYSFCFLYRQFNGDIKNNTADICRLSYFLSPCLRNDWKQLYPNLKASLRSDLLRQIVGLNNTWIEKGILEDVSKVLGNSFLICEQLYLVYNCFHIEFEKLDQSKLKSEKARKSKVQLNSTLQKIIFFMTIVRDMPQEVFKNIQIELKNLIKESEALDELKKDVLAK